MHVYSANRRYGVTGHAPESGRKRYSEMRAHGLSDELPQPKPKVLAIGYACYDLTFAVAHHLDADEKANASDFTSCGGGLAANAAAAAGALGYDTVLAAYLGHDIFGDAHVRELRALGVTVDRLLRADAPTGVSGIMVKPNGHRTLAAYRGVQPQYSADALDLDVLQPQAVLVDGHQRSVSLNVLKQARARGIPTVLDADANSAHSRALAPLVDHLVAAERFAYGYTGATTLQDALHGVARLAGTVVVTLGERGLVWARNGQTGSLPAYDVEVRDTNGAGDAFHGAYLGALAEGMDWPSLLRFASATGALCCQTVGSRHGLPGRAAVLGLMSAQNIA